MCKMKQEKALTLSTLFSSAVNLSALSLFPEAAAAISACSPVLQRSMELALSSMGASRMTDREKQRIGDTIKYAINIAVRNIETGRSIKQKELEGQEVEALIEIVCRAAAEDAQELKEKAYASLIGNFAFQDKFDIGALSNLAKILKDTPLDELCLIAALHGQETINYEPVYNALLNSGDLVAGELVNHFLSLRNRGITVRTYPFTTNHTIGSVKLSTYGEEFFELANLNELDPEESSRLKDCLNLYLQNATRP